MGKTAGQERHSKILKYSPDDFNYYYSGGSEAASNLMVNEEVQRKRFEHRRKSLKGARGSGGHSKNRRDDLKAQGLEMDLLEESSFL